jgi:hypothetical protein
MLISHTIYDYFYKDLKNNSKFSKNRQTVGLEFLKEKKD